MTDEEQKLDRLQADYQGAVEDWIAAIREEEALASVDHSVAQIDKWEAAGFHSHKKHRDVIFKKRLYEDALRHDIFGF